MLFVAWRRSSILARFDTGVSIRRNSRHKLVGVRIQIFIERVKSLWKNVDTVERGGARQWLFLSMAPWHEFTRHYRSISVDKLACPNYRSINILRDNDSLPQTIMQRHSAIDTTTTSRAGGGATRHTHTRNLTFIVGNSRAIRIDFGKFTYLDIGPNKVEVFCSLVVVEYHHC